MSATRLPNARDLAETLTMLLSRDVAVHVAKAGGTAADASLRFGALYRNPDGSLAALALTDAALGCGAGAALTLLPPRMAADCAARLDTAGPDAAVVENLFEVMNVLSSRFAAGPHPVSLERLESKTAALGPEADLLRKKPASRADFDVEIPGYGKGRLTLLAR